MQFFDFHLHPALKAQFNQVEKRDSPWTVLDSHFSAFEIIDSQSSFSQLANGNLSLVGLALHVPESNMASGLERAVSTIDKFRLIFKLIAPKAYNFITTKVNAATRLPQLKNQARYHETFWEELDNINQNLISNNRKVKILKQANEYLETDTSTIHCFITVEGLHCFFGQKDITTEAGWDEMKTNLKNFISHYKLISINLAHLQFNHIINHCFGVKIFNDSDFYPIGDGIFPSMEAKVYQLIDELSANGTLVDVKHMSYKARQQYYKYNNNRMPIVATHVGVAGLTAKESINYLVKRPKATKDNKNIFLVQRVKKLGHLNETSFNHCSINLYDEDILAIISSKGLMGISFDRRIIGFTYFFKTTDPGTTIYDEEYITTEELDFMFGAKPKYNFDETDILTPDTITDDSLRDEITLDLRYFFNQVFHILKVGQETTSIQEVAKLICIGSDFDGMIDPLQCCIKADKMNDMYVNAKNKFLSYAEEADIDVSGIPNLIDDIFFNNGKNFVLKRLN